MILAPRKWWPSPKALRQVQTWQSSPRSHVRGLQRRIWSFRAPSARIANSTVGQFYCGKCTEPLRDLVHSNVRRTVQMARLRAVNEICARSGMAPSSITVEHIRGSQGSDISQRGLLSLDAESTQTAKKQVKSALKLGFKSVLDRFINDVGFALRSTERGLTQSAMRVQDCIATAVLPNPGRSSEQRTMGVGAPRKHAVQRWRERNLHGPIPLPARGPSGASQSKSDYVSKRRLHGSILAWCSILLGRVCQPAVRHWPGEQDHHIRPVHRCMGRCGSAF